MGALNLMMGAAGASEKLYVDDVFSTYLYTGNGATQTITNGVDLAGKGGLVWIKNRTGANNNILFNTARGANNYLYSNLTNAGAFSALYGQDFNLDGFDIGSSFGEVNASTNNYVSWTFRNAPKFYWHDVVTKSAGSNATIDFANLGTLGMVRVKRTDSSGSWYVWHRSLTAGKLLIGETTAAETTLWHITVSGTTITLVNGVIADGTYLVEAWAHDDSADGLIQCGSFTTDGSGNATVTLGWEPQFIEWKLSSGVQDWAIFDSMRGITVGGNDQRLAQNTSATEASANSLEPTATGFTTVRNPSETYIYLAIRRPNKPPTSGTEVYNAIARTGTGAAATVTGAGFPPDLDITQARNGSNNRAWFFDRLRGANKALSSNLTNAEITRTDELMSFNMDGVTFGADVGGDVNLTSVNYINHFFRRAPGVFDVVPYDGKAAAGRTKDHGLKKTPELLFVKARNNAQAWNVLFTQNGGVQGFLNTPAAFEAPSAAVWGNGTAYVPPTDSQFSVGTDNGTNASGWTYIAYLFATLAGISKVGSYTGNGATQNIECGFGAGARFVLIKRTNAVGDWYLWDTARGIVAGNDPHLSLNSTATEVTTDDSIDPYAGGFAVNQNAATNINVNGAEYLFLAYS